MSKCINDKSSEMLFAYELGLLDPDQERKFEEHLLECEDCWKELDRAVNVSEHLRYSQRIRELLGKTQSESTRKTKRFVFTRVILVAALLVAIAIPVYQVWFQSSTPDVVQRLKLVPVRGQTDNLLSLEQGGTAEIQFVLSTAPEMDYIATITNLDGHVVYVDSSFTNFSEQGRGVVTLPVNTFEAGQYTLRITANSDTSGVAQAEYSFGVE